MKTCVLLFYNVKLNFRKFYKVVWINLEPNCKSYKEKRKTEIEKCFRTKKGEKKGTAQLGHARGPARQRPSQASPPAAPLSLSDYLFFLSSKLTGGTHLSSSTSGRRLRCDRFLPAISPLQSELMLPFLPHTSPISTPRAPLSSPFDHSWKPPPNQRRFLTGEAQTCHSKMAIPAE
jgi:hypothetical protein